MANSSLTLVPKLSRVKLHRSRARSLREILATPPRKLRHGQRWGAWRLDAHRLTMDFAPGGVWRYELDLERNHDSASILDFIFQVRAKQWATPQVLKDLLDALRAIFHPQANLCSFAVNKCIAPREFLVTRIELPTEAEREESDRHARQTYEAWGIPMPARVERQGHE